MLKKSISVMLAVVMIMGVFIFSPYTDTASAQKVDIAEVGAQQKAMFIMETMNISQGMYGSFSHQGSKAIDFTGNDGGIDPAYAPFDGKVVYISTSAAYIIYESTSPVEFADGTVDYMTVWVMHDNNVGRFYIGQTFSQGEHFFNEGSAGYATGNHIHLECARGTYQGQYKNDYGVWCIKNQINPYDALYLSESTYIINDYGYNWRRTSKLSFTPADLGTDFYGSIVNLAVNKPIKVSGGNVVCGIRNGSDEQKWRFERQGDLSYKIINVANGECLDDDNYGNTDNTNIKTCGSNDTDAQRWFFRNNGSGYSLVPKCAQNLAMDLVDGNSTEGNNIAAWTYVENNGNQIYGIDHQPSFTPVDIGTNFYGSIVNLAANKPIKVSNNNVVMGIRNGSDEQKWKFERMDDRMYKITNVATGKCLDDDNYGTTDDTNIKVIGSNNEPAQRWYFRKNGSGYSLVPRCAQNLAMDMVGGNSSEGNNVAAWTFVENNGNQIFGIDKQPSFTPQDLGDRFTVNIIHSSSGSVVTENSEKNVVIQKFNGSDSQKWLFERMDDRMYKITNVASGRVLDIDNGGTTDDTNIHTWASLDNLHQRWYLWKNGTGYSLVPKCSLNLSMDLVGGKTEDGSNLAAWTSVSGNVNQIYTLELKVVEPTTPTEHPTTPTEPPTTPTEQPTTLTEPTTPTEPKTIILGDVDGDGEVTIIDATAIQRHLASIPTASYNEKAADADGDGSVTILDATAIQLHLAQLPANENIGKPIA